MENQLTTEQKARVFAQYLGRQVTNQSRCDDPINHQKHTLGGCYTDRLILTHPTSRQGWTGDADHWQHILRPLSAITDEDAIELCKVCVGVCIPSVAKGKRFAGNIERGCNSRFDPEANFTAGSQFLIQRGYAVPLFIAPGHPLNGKTAIDMGLAIDATTPQRSDKFTNPLKTETTMPKTISFEKFRELWDSAPESLRPVLALDVPVFYTNEYTLRDGTLRATRAASEGLRSERFADATRAVLPPPVDFSRLRSGSRVRIEYTEQHCHGREIIDFGRPVIVVLYNSPFAVGTNGIVANPARPGVTFCVFEQDGKLCVFAAGVNTEYIIEVLEY